ncbi:MAG: hypothetical protein KF708_14875 [Pirellulales bacterium]|nr:hypothetical protein [Pirellulales bacterium]
MRLMAKSSLTLGERLSAILRSEATFFVVGGVVVASGLAYCYDVWRRRNRGFDGPDDDDVDPQPKSPSAYSLEEEALIDEALEESFPASDPPAFTARGSERSHARRNGAMTSRPRAKTQISRSRARRTTSKT